MKDINKNLDDFYVLQKFGFFWTTFDKMQEIFIFCNVEFFWKNLPKKRKKNKQFSGFSFFLKTSKTPDDFQTCCMLSFYKKPYLFSSVEVKFEVRF